MTGVKGDMDRKCIIILLPHWLFYCYITRIKESIGLTWQQDTTDAAIFSRSSGFSCLPKCVPCWVHILVLYWVLWDRIKGIKLYSGDVFSDCTYVIL